MLNKVMIIGHLGRDPELRYTQTGAPIATLNIATDESYTDRDGNKVERTEWHRVVIFNTALANVAERYLHKGSKVYLEGQLQTRKWEDNNGQERYTTEVIVPNFSGSLVLLDAKGDGTMGGDNSVFTPAGGASGWDSTPSAAPSADLDDDIPF